MLNEDQCVACKEVAAEGFAMGRLCYHCIEKTVVTIISQEEQKPQQPANK